MRAAVVGDDMTVMIVWASERSIAKALNLSHDPDRCFPKVVILAIAEKALDISDVHIEHHSGITSKERLYVAPAHP